MNTNRREFLARLFTILPAACSYKRVWKAVKGSKLLHPEWIPNPLYKDAEYELKFVIYGDTIELIGQENRNGITNKDKIS